MLTDPHGSSVKRAARLATRKARSETGLFLVEGPQAVREALDFNADAVIDMFATEDAEARHPDLFADARARRVRVQACTPEVLRALSDTVHPQGVVAVVEQRVTPLADALAGARLVAVLHEVRDPGNLGTIIRAADAAGADAVVISGDSVDPWNPKVARSTTGSLFHVPIAIEKDLRIVARETAEARLTLVAADVNGDDLDPRSTELAESTAWLFGNEARGLDDGARALAARVRRLPIFGAAESLNLAIAASVLMYESAFAQRTHA